jgi:hypothetical protein
MHIVHKALGVIALAAAAIGTAQAQVGVSINLRQPGVYGRIDIGGLPPPALVLPQPVLIAPPQVVVQRAPIYLYVPPFHQQNWRRYCGQYNACGQPVYFVQDQWVRQRYAEHHPEWHNHDHGRGWDRHDHDRDHHDHGDHGDHRDHGRGPGHDHDHGR